MWYSLTDTQDGLDIQTVQPLWESSSRAPTQVDQGLTLTATLPLELELIVQGYCTSFIYGFVLLRSFLL